MCEHITGGNDMKIRRRRTIKSIAVIVGLAGALGNTVAGCALAPAETDDSRVAAVGRITDIDGQHGYAIVEFPNGRMVVSIDKRDLDKYVVGDELRVDSYGRPLPPQPRSPRSRG